MKARAEMCELSELSELSLLLSPDDLIMLAAKSFVSSRCSKFLINYLSILPV
jgi:hypothetical protein